MRLAFSGILFSFACIAVSGALVGSGSEVGRAFGFLFAVPVVVEGLVLGFNWRRSTYVAQTRFRARFQASPLRTMSVFEIRMIGAFLLLIGVILAVGNGARL